MKKLITKFFTVVFALLLFTGCKKDDNKTTSQGGCKINSVETNGKIIAITYNSDGRVASINEEGLIESFEYNGNKLTATYSGVQTIITLNADTFPINARKENGSEWQNTDIEYNGKQISKETLTQSQTLDAVVTTYKWSGGNLSSLINNDGEETTYTYYTDQPARQGDFFNIKQEPFYRIRNTNLVKSETSNDGDDVKNLTYSFDSEGKITSLKIVKTTLFNTTTSTFNYHYLCN